MAGSFRKKPVVVQAFRWDGGDTDSLSSFVGMWNWGRADVKEVPWDHDDKEQE